MTPLLSAQKRRSIGSATENLPSKTNTIWIALICINIIKSKALILNCNIKWTFGSHHHSNSFTFYQFPVSWFVFHIYFTAIRVCEAFHFTWIITTNQTGVGYEYNKKLLRHKIRNSATLSKCSEPTLALRSSTSSTPAAAINYYCRFANAQWANMKLWFVKCRFI